MLLLPKKIEKSLIVLYAFDQKPESKFSIANIHAQLMITISGVLWNLTIVMSVEQCMFFRECEWVAARTRVQDHFSKRTSFNHLKRCAYKEKLSFHGFVVSCVHSGV